MKKLILTLAAFLVAGMEGSFGTPVSGESLNVNDPATNPPQTTQSVANGAGAVGYGNSITANGSLGLGAFNLIGTPNTLGVGTFNLVNGSSMAGSNSLAVGNGNLGGSLGIGSTLQNSALIGAYNGRYNSSPILNSLIVGEANSASLTDGFVAGKNNAVSGQHYVMGEGLVTNTNPLMVVLGKYNASPAAGQLFIIGNGTSSARKNAVEVYTDGTVRIPKPQGDISMGEFGE